MRKKIILLCAGLFILAIGLFNTPRIGAETGKIIVTGNGVNVREEPGTSYPVITQIHEGETYPFKNHRDGWYEISLPDGKTGWVADWLAARDGGRQAARTGTVTADRLNIREAPGQDAAVTGKLISGDIVHIIKEENGWLQIDLGGKTAWVSAEFVGGAYGTAEKETNAGPAEEGAIRILHDGTNIREGAGTSTGIIATASSGEIYQVLEKIGEWFKIKVKNGKNGYVAGWIVSREDAPEKPRGSKGLAGKTIVLDPGHGGRDQGASGAKGTLEKDLTLRTAGYLAGYLEDAGAKVIITRSGDRYKSLQSRTETAMASTADAFISLHYDSAESGSIQGHTTYYYHGYEKGLADAVHGKLADLSATRDRGVRHGDYFVIRENTVPSVLLELGYMSNKKEENMIRTKRHQKKAAKAIYEGLDDYFGQ